ncbi:MAG: leucine-rich repeat protein [Bacteroidales bacterium]|nr:leucine-rich repeat protein [Bacteroidales bacterium]
MKMNSLYKKSVALLILLFAVGWQAKAAESRDGELIVFADDNVKAICVANWDTSGDGELSMDEAAAVTDLGNLFQGNGDITSFDELQYFTGLTSLVYDGDIMGTFSGCFNLTSVVIPNTVSIIGDYAFQGCESFTSMIIPNSVVTIGEAAFGECYSLASINIPNTVTSIGISAFYACTSLTSITIPSTVTFIGEDLLDACNALESITVEEGNPVYDSRDNCNAIIETATNTLIEGCKNTIIPNTVTSIGMAAFAEIESLTSMIIPSSVTTIGEWAFVDCTQLSSIIISSSVQSIGNYAFLGCSGLTSMIIFNPDVEVGDDAFEGVSIPENTFVAASVSPAEGGSLFGLFGEDEDYQAFMGTYDLQNYVVEYVSQGSGQISSNVTTILVSHRNEGWQFTGWYLNGELVSYDPVLLFRAFGSFAFEARFEPCSYVSDPELLSGRFSISGCSTVGFTKSNVIINGDLMESMSNSISQLSIMTDNGIPGLTWELGENQWDCMTYDSTEFYNNPMLYIELMMAPGVDLFPLYYFKGDIGCWHVLTGSEWDYLLNQRETESGVRFVFAKVNEVNGLVVLPDDWAADTYTFAHANEIADYQNNIITADMWLATLEPAGAVFLPVNGIIYTLEGMIYLPGNGKMGAYPGLFISPSGSFLGTELPMTGDIVNVFTSLFGTSLRLAQITPQPNTVTINVATEQSERGIVTGGGEVNCGQTCTVTATANPGYVFQFWTENGQIVSTETIYNFKAKGNRDLVAQFANVDEVCNVVFDLMGQDLGWGGSALLVEYDDVSFQLTMPTPEEFSLLQIENSIYGNSQSIIQSYPVFIDRNASVNLSWQFAAGVTSGSAPFVVHYEDGDTIFNGNNENLPYVFECVCEDVSCAIVADAVPSHYGWVEGGGSYTYGTTCTLTATANEHYHFTGWKENGVLVCETPVYSFTVTSNRTLEATFEENGYYVFSVAVEPEEGGELMTWLYEEMETPYVSDEPIEEDDISIVARANEGWRFAYWTANDEVLSANNVYTFHLSENTDLVAHFEQCELETEPDPDLLSGRFSISGCTTVGFAKGNVIAQIEFDTIYWSDPDSNEITEKYNPTSASWQFAETQYYRQAYDAEYISENGISELLAEGMDLVWDVYRYLGVVDIGCWHQLSGAEWEYLLNGRPTEVRYAFAKVNDVAGLLVLPDDWDASTYQLESPNTVAAYETNIISLSDWENMEEEGALFLPANGMLINPITLQEYLYQFDPGDGSPVGLYGNMMFHPMIGIENGFSNPQWGYMMAEAGLFSSLRLAQIVEQAQSTITVAVEASQADYGTVSQGGDFACGDECTVVATANDGYVFRYWLDGDEVASVDAEYTFVVAGDRNLTAVFADVVEVCNVEFDLVSDPNYVGMFGWGGEAIQLSFDDGTPSIVLTMPVPDMDWNALIIANMAGQNVSLNEFDFPQSQVFTLPINKGTTVELSWLMPTMATITFNHKFSASYETGEPIIENAGSGNLPFTFQCNCEDITLAVDPEVGGYIITEGTLNIGETITLTAVANEHFTFVNWTFNGIEVSTDPTYSFVVTEEGDMVAHFELLPMFTVTASANPSEGGTVTFSTSSSTFHDGTEYNIVPIFGWRGDCYQKNEMVYPASELGFMSGVDITSMKFYATEPSVNLGSAYYRVFLTEIDSEQITSYVGSGNIVYYGRLSVENGEMIVDFTTPYHYNGGNLLIGVYKLGTGSQVAFGWYGETRDGASLQGFDPYSLNDIVPSQLNFLPKVTFFYDSYGVYQYGETCIISSDPSEGYEFVNWTEDGEVVSTEAEYSFTVTEGRDLMANFVLKNYDILVTADPEEGGTVTGAGNYNHWSQCTLTATANVGYTFINWTLDGTEVSTESTYTFTVTGAGAYVANFLLNNYTITAYANPSEGGTVNGAGTYNHFETCTLTAEANVGYNFDNWTLDGTVVSTEPTYTFTVTGAGNYVANFSLKTYEITAMVTPTEAGTVNGTGTYTHGTQCTLTAMPGEDYTFMYWFEGGNMVSYDATYSFIATGDRSFVAHFAENEQTFILESGWTWLSSYIEMEDINGLAMLENGLNPNGVMIKSQRDGFLSYANGMWMGTLEAITNEKMYLVNTSDSTEVTFTGPVAQLNAHPITLNPNWTWLGYPSPFAVDIDDALSNLNPTNGDVVKSQSSFAAYNDVDGWYGTLSTLTPGMGLMYQSHNSQPVTFNYGVGMNRALRANLTAEDNHWVPDVHAYPNNMNIMAVVELNGVELENERYELAIFDGNECRGSVRLIYVESMRRYVAFLTVAGEEDAELCLALYDTMTGEAYYNTTDCLNFEANAVLGSLSMPYIARFGGTAELNELGDPTVVLYPNPVSAGHLFQMALPDESKGARVSIVNALGAVVSTTDVYDKPAILCAPAVPGVYTVRIVTAKQGTYCRKLIVK